MKTLIVMSILLCLIPCQILAQYVYFSPNGDCSVDGSGCMNYFSEFHIFILAQDVSDAIGASFFIEGYEPSDFGNEHISSIEPHDNVVIEYGDLFSGIMLSWPAGQYSTDTLLTMRIDLNNPPVLSMGVYTKDIRLYRSNGDTLHLDDFLFYCSYCSMPTSVWIDWFHQDTVMVQIGSSTEVSIDCLGHTNGFGLTGTAFNAFDQERWLNGCVDCSITCICATCPWDVTSVLVNVSVPDTVLPGTSDLLRLIPTGPCCLEDSTRLYLYAVPDVGTEKKSWGAIKRQVIND